MGSAMIAASRLLGPVGTLLDTLGSSTPLMIWTTALFCRKGGGSSRRWPRHACMTVEFTLPSHTTLPRAAAREKVERCSYLLGEQVLCDDSAGFFISIHNRVLRANGEGLPGEHGVQNQAILQRAIPTSWAALCQQSGEGRRWACPLPVWLTCKRRWLLSGTRAQPAVKQGWRTPVPGSAPAP